MRSDITLGDERLRRPTQVFRYTFDDFFDGPGSYKRIQPAHGDHCVVPVEAAVTGDLQVVAARDLGASQQRVVDLDPLADIPSVESIIACARVRVTRDLPGIREFLQGPLRIYPRARPYGDSLDCRISTPPTWAYLPSWIWTCFRPTRCGSWRSHAGG
ncbi:MAG: hypothetical protein HQM09_16765 [Candidatus Riflebacteria bacterium]|nr:hypothetical protein [Candidatus Riflebacteria bacterium]